MISLIIEMNRTAGIKIFRMVLKIRYFFSKFWAFLPYTPDTCENHPYIYMVFLASNHMIPTFSDLIGKISILDIYFLNSFL
jgi:hypothetical protein